MTNEREQREKAAGDEKSGRWGICTIGLLDPAPDDSAAPLIPSSYDQSIRIMDWLSDILHLNLIYRYGRVFILYITVSVCLCICPNVSRIPGSARLLRHVRPGQANRPRK